MSNRISYSFPLKAVTVLGAAMAVSTSASASIIRLDINQYTANGIPFYIDVNGDSVNDLQFSYSYSSYYNGSNGDLYANGLGNTRVTAGGSLAMGETIDETGFYTNSNHLADYNYYWWSGSCGRYSCSSGGSNTSYYGTWNQGGSTINGYLGFALSDGVSQYFGWANLSMYSYGNTFIREVAFESCANVGIVAGQTSSGCNPTEVPEPAPLALLAIGAAGVSLMRRRRKLAA